jgi:threonine synthase
MGVIERYRDRLPVSAETPVVSLGEGSTPLLPAPRLSRRLGVELWLKWEAANPTGSYKDRGMTLAVSKALEAGAQALICASTGNTAASAAAYGARAGVPVVVLQPAGAVAAGKLAQTRALGARVLEVRGSFDAALDAAKELAARGTHALVNSVNPHRIEAQKTAVFEIVEELGSEPDALYLPYGGGGNTTAYALGLREVGAGAVRLVAAEAADRPGTAATAIRIETPAHAERVAETPAEIATVDDAQILEAWRALAQEEGLFCEPASAAGLAALIAEGGSSAGRVVCTITGHGLKDPEYAVRHAPAALTVEPDADAIAAAAL